MTRVKGPLPVSPTTNGPTSPGYCSVWKPASERSSSILPAQRSSPSRRALTEGMATRSDRSFLAAARSSGEGRILSPGKGRRDVASRLMSLLGSVVAEPLFGNRLDGSVLQHCLDRAVDLFPEVGFALVHGDALALAEFREIGAGQKGAGIDELVRTAILHERLPGGTLHEAGIDTPGDQVIRNLIGSVVDADIRIGEICTQNLLVGRSGLYADGGLCQGDLEIRCRL